MTEKPKAAITSAGHFLDKYLLRRLTDDGYDIVDGENPDLAIHIAGHGDLTSATSLKPKRLVIIIPGNTEVDIPDTTLPGCVTTIMRLPHVVGTGMTGILIEIVAMIKRGTMFHVAGNEARVSVIHALDVARLALTLSAVGGDYTLSDGINPTWHDLVEALSVRVDHKRVTTIKPSWAKYLAWAGPIIGGPDRDMLSKITTDSIVEASELPVAGDMINVVEYLSTHNYDDHDI